jgi:hypothetical protein
MSRAPVVGQASSGCHVAAIRDKDSPCLHGEDIVPCRPLRRHHEEDASEQYAVVKQGGHRSQQHDCHRQDKDVVRR